MTFTKVKMNSMLKGVNFLNVILYVLLNLARSCSSEPAEPFLGIDVDWPKNSYVSGTKITYTCPYKKMTNEEFLTGI